MLRDVLETGLMCFIVVALLFTYCLVKAGAFNGEPLAVLQQPRVFDDR